MSWSREGYLSYFSLDYVLISVVAGVLTAFYATARSRPIDKKELPSGAQSVPKIKGKWPGNIDILLELIYSESSDYPTEGIARWCREYGPTFDMGILWSHQIVSGMFSVPPTDALDDETMLLQADPEVARTVLHKLDSFEKSEKWNRMVHTFLGNGIFAVDGALWERVSHSSCFLAPLLMLCLALVAASSHCAPFFQPQPRRGRRFARSSCRCRRPGSPRSFRTLDRCEH